MLRLVLLVLYLLASSLASPEKQGGSLDPLGLSTPPPQDGGNTNPPSDGTDQGGSLDPLG